jgi:hypothetical protein
MPTEEINISSVSPAKIQSSGSPSLILSDLRSDTSFVSIMKDKNQPVLDLAKNSTAKFANEAEPKIPVSQRSLKFSSS